MEEREVLLRIGEGKDIKVLTGFDQDQLNEAADIIQEDLMDTDDGWNEDKVVSVLEQKGYIKVLGPAPEIIDLLI